MDLEIEILLALVHGREMYGLQIADALNKKLDKSWLGWPRVGFGNLYPALHRFRNKGDVIARQQDFSEMTPEEFERRLGVRKMYYRISDCGGRRIREREKAKWMSANFGDLNLSPT